MSIVQLKNVYHLILIIHIFKKKLPDFMLAVNELLLNSYTQPRICMALTTWLMATM